MRFSPFLQSIVVATATLPVALGQELSATSTQDSEGHAVEPTSAVPGSPVVWDGADVLAGTASPAARGEVFYQPAETAAAATARSDEELANAPAIDPFSGSMHEAVHFAPDGDALWIRGKSYKAQASADGFTYIPFLGSNAPRNYPVAFRLRSAVLSGVPLALDASAGVSRVDNRIVLQRGPVDVVYDVALEQIEQSFRVDAAGAAGDLVLTLDVQSDLVSSRAGAGFRFDGPDGGMNYGAATVLDGRGRAAGVPAELQGGVLTLTVPASFLLAAEGQIVVDPILTTFTVDTASGDQGNVDVAYDATSDSYTFVYEDTFSATDRDLYRRTYQSNATYVGGGYVDSSADDWRNPSIANLNGEDAYLIVAARSSGTGYSDIVGRTLGAGPFLLGPVVVIGDTGSSTRWSNARPDVGGNSTSAPGGSFLVTWERIFSPTQTLPRMRTVQADGTLGTLMTFDNGVDLSRTEVVVSESTGNPSTVNVWNVAYRSVSILTGSEQIRGVTVNAAGAITNGPGTLYLVPAGSSARDIDVSDGLALGGYAPTYLVSFDNYAAVNNDVDLVVCRNNSFRRHLDLNLREHAILSRDQDQTQLGTTTEDFLVTYLEASGGQWTAYMTCLDLTEASEIAISERRTWLGTAGSAIQGGAALASRASGGLNSRYSGIGWARYDALGSDFEMEGATHYASNGYAGAFQYCESTANSTGDRSFLAMVGSSSTSATKTLVASALPGSQFGLLLTGSSMDFVPNPGGSRGNLCLGGQLGRYNALVSMASPGGVVSFAINPAVIPTPFGLHAAVAGDRYQWQLWHRDVVGGVATSNFTNAVSLLFQ